MILIRIAINYYYHIDCVTCSYCQQLLDINDTIHVVKKDQLYCHQHYCILYLPRCWHCHLYIKEAHYIQLQQQTSGGKKSMMLHAATYHTQCFQCSFCQLSLVTKTDHLYIAESNIHEYIIQLAKRFHQHF